MRGLSEITAEVWLDWAKAGRAPSLPPDRLEPADDREFWDEVEQRFSLVGRGADGPYASA